MKATLNTNNIYNFNKNRAVSFKGFYNSKLLLRTLKFAADNGSLFSAATSLALSTAARPVAILATPKTDNENKKIACAKSISSSAAGYLIMLAASLPVSKAVKRINRNPAKFLDKSAIENLKNGAKTLAKSESYMFATQLFKLGLGFVIAVPKSALTCALIPTVMAAAKIFSKKGHKQEQKEERKVRSKNISFKGFYNQTTETIAKGIGKLINKKPFQEFAKKYYDTNFAQHIMSMTDVLLTLTFVERTAKSKKIKQERKRPLIHNSLISTGLCLTGGYAMNYALKKPTDKFIKKFSEVNKGLPNLEKYIEGIKIAKPVLILGVIYYIFIPIIATFLADRTDAKSGRIRHLDQAE